MVGDEAFHRTLEDGAQTDAHFVGSLCQHVFVIVGYGTDEVDFMYSPQYFKPSAAEILFRDFIITFVVGDTRFMFVAELPNTVSVYRIDNEEKVLVHQNIALSQIEFKDREISLAGDSLNPVSKVILASKN